MTLHGKKEQLHILQWYKPLTFDRLEVLLGCETPSPPRDVGRLAFALPHGSLLLEVAKQEYHATTALPMPNRLMPTWIGMVFYTHASLNLPLHSQSFVLKKQREGYFDKYLRWVFVAHLFRPMERSKL